MTDKPPIRVTIVDDDWQPGDHVSSHHPHPALVRVLHNPYRGIPASPRRTFLLYVVFPVVAVAVSVAVLLGVIIANNMGLF